METQTEWKKRSTTIIKPSKLEVGDTVIEGNYFGTRTREITDRDSGELKQLTDLLFKKDGQVFAIPQDSGMKVSFSDSRVKEGELVKMVKLDQIKNNRGQPLNQYDIYVQ